MTLDQIKDLIQSFPDFPKPGINFKDISPILEDPIAFRETIQKLAELIKDVDFDYIVGIDARGFIFGAALAHLMEKGFVMCRKASKLPGELTSQSFDYEYAEAVLTLQSQRLKKGKKYLIVDDVLATGNTLSAVCQMIQRSGATLVGVEVFIYLAFLEGKKNVTSQTQLSESQIFSLLTL